MLRSLRQPQALVSLAARGQSNAATSCEIRAAVASTGATGRSEPSEIGFGFGFYPLLSLKAAPRMRPRASAAACCAPSRAAAVSPAPSMAARDTPPRSRRGRARPRPVPRTRRSQARRVYLRRTARGIAARTCAEFYPAAQSNSLSRMNALVRPARGSFLRARATSSPVMRGASKDAASTSQSIVNPSRRAVLIYKRRRRWRRHKRPWHYQRRRRRCRGRCVRRRRPSLSAVLLSP